MLLLILKRLYLFVISVFKMPEHRDQSPEDISEKPEETTGSGISKLHLFRLIK